MMDAKQSFSRPLKWNNLFYSFVLICLSLALLTSCESKKTIVNQLDEKEANEIIVFLSTKGIDANKVPIVEGGGGGGAAIPMFDIVVPEEQATQAMSLLNQAGLPRRRGQSLLGIFKDVGLVPSEMQEKIRYQAGLAEQIASTIRKIDGVLDAEVQVSFPEEDPLNPGKTKGEITASILLKHSGVFDDPNTQLESKIRRLVTSSVTGLKYDNVTVIPTRARFSEYPLGLQGMVEEDKDYVRTWTIIVAKQSLPRFRVVFFSFIFISLFLFLILVWIGWKIYPLLHGHGGFASLFSLSPLETPQRVAVEEEEGDEEEEEEVEEDKKKEKKKAKKSKKEDDDEEEDEGPPSDVT